MVTFSHTKISIQISDIENIEKYVQLILPEEYKKHLLKYNGGRCKPNIFKFFEKNKLARSNVEWFFAIHNGELSNLLDNINDYKLKHKRLPNQIFPIARDAFGNLICISCGEKDFGSIYFWDHENEVDYQIENDNNYDNLYSIAKSFNDFINSLE